MGSNQEIEKIQNWIANWYGTTVESCPFSREDIRNISRGPMREVLVDFLVPRFRTDTQIKVIRSNLFLMDSVLNRSLEHDMHISGVNKDEEHIKQLKNKIQETLEHKIDIIKQILKGTARVREPKFEKVFLQTLTHFEQMECQMKLLAHRVLSTTSLLDEIVTMKPPTQVQVDPTLWSTCSEETARIDTVSPHLAKFQELYSNTCDLFDLHCIQPDPPTDPNISHSSSSPEFRSLLSVVSAQTADLGSLSLKPSFLEKWARREQDTSISLINRADSKFSNVMSPVEELTNEAKALHIKLMKAQVNLHFKNRELNKTLEELTEEKNRKIKNTILNEAIAVPQNFLAYIQKEEQYKKLLKCRELMKQFKSIGALTNDCKNSDMLALLCDESCSPTKSDNRRISVISNIDNSGVAASSNCLNQASQKTLEDLTCALLKNFPAGRNGLETTVSECQSLVMEKFANLFFGENSVNGNSRLMNAQTDNESKILDSSDFNIKISPSVFKQDLFTLISDVPIISEQSRVASLNEVLMAQNKLKENRLLCETLLKQQGFTSVE